MIFLHLHTRPVISRNVLSGEWSCFCRDNKKEVTFVEVAAQGPGGPFITGTKIELARGASYFYCDCVGRKF